MNEAYPIQGVILAGGRGERFWPLSRPSRPKQLLALFGDKTLLRATWDRLRVRLDREAIWVILGDNLVPEVRMALPGLRGDHLVPEVVGKNTAPALAVAAALGVRGGQDPIQLVVPSDHRIPDEEAFWESVEQAVAVAAGEPAPLVTFGIPITRPDIGYGYIERGAPREGHDGAWCVHRFHEKPDEVSARAYQTAGTFFWNSGIFVWRARAFLAEVARWMPALRDLVSPLETAPEPVALLPEIFRRAEAQSVDFGVLEHSANVAVVAAGFAWSDVGTWASWGELANKDAAGNATHGDVFSLESDGCVLYAEEGLIATLGVRDLVVVRTDEVTLVVPKARSQEVRDLLRALRARDVGDAPDRA